MIALASSFRDRPVPSDLAAIGEVGLTGELRAVSALGQRLSEVRRLGFTKCLIPKRVQGKLSVPEGLDADPGGQHPGSTGRHFVSRGTKLTQPLPPVLPQDAARAREQ